MTLSSSNQQSWYRFTEPPMVALNALAARSMRCEILGLDPPDPDPPPLDTVLPTDIEFESTNYEQLLVNLIISIDDTAHEMLLLSWYPDWSGAPPPPRPRFQFSAYVPATGGSHQIAVTCRPDSIHLLCRTIDIRDGRGLGDQIYTIPITWEE